MNVEDLVHGREAGHQHAPGGLEGTWTNGLGSVMELHCDGESGALTGRYTSGVRDKHTYDLRGFANATTVAFTVNFASSASIGTWAGHFDAESGELDMLWHLVAEPKADELWDTTFAGFDTFTRRS
jgi:hypothetical protein